MTDAAPLDPFIRDRIAKAIVDVDDQLNEDGILASITIADVAEESGTPPEQVKEFVQELLNDGIARLMPRENWDDFVLDAKAKKWRKRLGI